MSLVEVIISITILTIVIVPTLSVLTSAMAYNIKARKRQQATIMAESIMEAFKGYDIATLEKKFKNGTFRADGTTVTTDVSSGDSSEDGGNYSCKKDSSGVYTFTINKYEDFDNDRTYEVTIVATPKTMSDTYVQYSMNPTNSGIYIGTADESNDDTIKGDVLGAFVGGYFDALLSEANSYCADGKNATDSDGIDLGKSNTNLDIDNVVIVSRTMTFDINHNGSSYTVDSKVKYEYYIKNFTFYVPVNPASLTDPLEGDNPTYESGGKLYYLEEKSISEYYSTSGNFEFETTSSTTVNCGGITDDNKMENLYIYYYPYYYGTSANSDTIKIKNNTSNNVNCYVMKQKYTDINLSTLKNLEQKYKPLLDTSESKGSVIVYHNFNVNLTENTMFDNFNNVSGVSYDIADITKGSSVTYTASIGKDQTNELTVLYDIELTMKDFETGSEVANLKSVMYETVGGASVEEEKED